MPVGDRRLLGCPLASRSIAAARRPAGRMFGSASSHPRFWHI